MRNFMLICFVVVNLICSEKVRAYTAYWYDGYQTTAASLDINFEYNTPRQGGPYTQYVANGTIQPTNYHQQLVGAGDPNPMQLQLAGDASLSPALVSPNRNFKGTYQNQAIGKAISFNLDVGVSIQGPANSYTWAGITFGSASSLKSIGSTGCFAIRFVEDFYAPPGGVNYFMQFYDGSSITANVVPNPAGGGTANVWIEIDDPVDGNPWDGVGSTVIKTFVNGSLLNTYSKGSGGYTSNYITLEGFANANGNAQATHRFDDLTVFSASANFDGDANLDGNVNLTDLQILAAEWLSTDCSLINLYCQGADFPSTRDNEVDMQDFDLLGGNWLTTRNTYYISFSEGNDSNSGLSESTPWKTFNNINAITLQPGKKVLLKRGDTWTQELNLRGNGTSTNPIELSAYGSGDRPIISRSDLTSQFCVVIQNGNYWNINNLDLRNAKLGLYLRYINSNKYGANRGMTITDCHFQNMSHPGSDAALYDYEVAFSTGIWIGGRVNTFDPDEVSNPVLDGMTIQRCTFADCIQGISTNWYWPEVNKDRVTHILIEDCHQWGKSVSGIVALSQASNAMIRRARHTDGVAEDFEGGTTAAFLQDCENISIDDSEFSDMKRPSGRPDGSGIDIEGGNHNITISNSVFHNNDGPGILMMSNPGGTNANTDINIFDNVTYNNTLNAYNDNSRREFVNWHSNSNGQVTNCGIYRSTAALGWFYSSTTWANFVRSVNRESYYSNVSGRPLTWEFNTGGNFEGWGGFNQWTSENVNNGSLNGISTGIDPYVQSGMTWINTHHFPVCRIRMAVSAGSNAQVFFVRETHPTWDEAKSMIFQIIADGQYHEYAVNLRAGCPEYKGVVTQLRLDPTDASGASMAVDYVRFSAE